jgi:hypothetical protein
VVTYTEKERKIPMKYTVTINEKSRSITVTLADGTKGVARCCPTDRFDINTGVELALERAKVASKAKNEPAPANPSIMELVKALEKALPEGEMVIVGNGDYMTEKQKSWLRSLAGVSSKCHCDCYYGDSDEDGDYESGYDDGYADGYADAEADYEDTTDNEEALNRIRSVLEDVGIM